MSEWRRSGWHNPGNWYCGLGAGVLLVSLWFPWLSATRTTRIEQRADDIAAALRDAALLLPMADADCEPAPGMSDVLFARATALLLSRSVAVHDLERFEPTEPDALLWLANKHYAFQVAFSPPEANQRIGRHTVPPVEVVAWPLSSVGPGHCAFFYPDDAERAYSRNLRASYAGFDRRPLPGSSQRPLSSVGSQRTGYAGQNGERWIPY